MYGVEERPVPQDGFIEDERPWPTQPFPVKPPPMARMGFTPAEIAKITPEHQKYCEGLIADNGGAHFGGPYVSFNRTATTIFFPSTVGGGLWQGVSFDPKLGYILVNSMSLGDIGHHGGGPRFWDRRPAGRLHDSSRHPGIAHAFRWRRNGHKCNALPVRSRQN